MDGASILTARVRLSRINFAPAPGLRGRRLSSPTGVNRQGRERDGVSPVREDLRQASRRAREVGGRPEAVEDWVVERVRVAKIEEVDERARGGETGGIGHILVAQDNI